MDSAPRFALSDPTTRLVLAMACLSMSVIFWRGLKHSSRNLPTTKSRRCPPLRDSSYAQFQRDIAAVESVALECEFENELLPDPAKLAYDLRQTQQTLKAVLAWIGKRDTEFLTRNAMGN